MVQERNKKKKKTPPREGGHLGRPAGAPLRSHRGSDHRDRGRGGPAQQERRVGAQSTADARARAVQRRDELRGDAPRQGEAAARHLQRRREEAEDQVRRAGRRLPALCAVALPEHHRSTLEGPPLADGSLATGDPPARVRPEGPKIEYKKEGFELFQIMKGRIAASTIGMIMRVEPVQHAATQQPAQGRTSGTLPPLPQRRQQPTVETHGEALAAAGGAGGPTVQSQTAPLVPAGPRVRRNDPCPRGGGNKNKKCHLPREQAGA